MVDFYVLILATSMNSKSATTAIQRFDSEIECVLTRKAILDWANPDSGSWMPNGIESYEIACLHIKEGS